MSNTFKTLDSFFSNLDSITNYKFPDFKDEFIYNFGSSYSSSSNDNEMQLRIVIPAVNKETLSVETDLYNRTVKVQADIVYDTLGNEEPKTKQFNETFRIGNIWDIESPTLVKYKDGVLYIRFGKKQKYNSKKIEVQF